MVAVEKNQPATIQNGNKPIRDAWKLSKSRSAVLNPFVQQASFSLKAWYFSKLQRPLHKRKTRLLLHELASLLHHSVWFIRFACGAWPSTGVVRASCIHSVKIKTAKSSSKESAWTHSVKFCTSKNFPQYGNTMNQNYTNSRWISAYAYRWKG